MLDNGGGVRGEEELGGHGHAIISHEGTRLGAVKQRLVGSSKETTVGREKVGAALLESNVLRSGFSRESILLRKLNVDKVNLHAALSLDTNDQGRTLAGRNDLVRVVDRLDEQAIGALEFLDDGLGEVGETDLGVLVVNVLCELGNALGIGLGLELETLAAEQGLEFLVVCNDTVVDDGELPGGIRAVGVAVDSGRRTVGSPSGVGDTSM